MPTSSQIGLKKSKTQVDIEKTRKTAHREAIAKANLQLVKTGIDRSAGFRSSQLIQDQKIIYRRFQTKLLHSQLNHARVNGDKEKLREVKSKLMNLRLLDDDDEYDFFKRLSSETARERANQLGRSYTVGEDDFFDAKRSKQHYNEQYDSAGELVTDDEELLAHVHRTPSPVVRGSHSVIVLEVIDNGDATPSPSFGVAQFASKAPSIRTPAHSARGLNRTTETEFSDSPKTTARSVTFSQSDKAPTIRPESQQHPQRHPTSTADKSEGTRSKSCQPQIATQTPFPAPPAYEPVEKTPSSRPQTARALKTPTPSASTVMPKDPIVAVAYANTQSRSPSPSSGRVKSAAERTSTASPKPSENRPNTAANIFQKKTGPSKLEKHVDWMHKRNYRGAVRNFCESLFLVPEPEPEPPAPEPPKEEERPKTHQVRGSRRMSVAPNQATVEPPKEEASLTPQAPPSAPKKLIPPISIFDCSELLMQDLTAMKRKSKPVYDAPPVDPSEFRREGGNLNVRNLTMSRVHFY